MSKPESRQSQVLEEIQKAKTTLLKQQGAAISSVGGASGGPLGGLPLPHPISATPINNHFSITSAGDVHASPAQRQALQALQQANATSFGWFIASDSHFGNAILPVLPRLPDPNKTKVEY